MDVRVGLWRKLSSEELMLLHPLDCKEIQPIHPEGYPSWVFIGRTDAEGETPILWPPHGKIWLIGEDPDSGRVGGAGGEGDERGRDGWMASPTWWTRVWVNSGSLWWTGRPGMLQFMGSQRIGHGWVTELHWTGEFSGSLGCLTHHSPAKVSGLICDCWIEISQIMSHGIKGNWSKHI